uniref:Putative secreted protein n=1 Tax=Anopheles darlingi TaxID=43151 RepID=A0A2M4DBC5_ANODA
MTSYSLHYHQLAAASVAVAVAAAAGQADDRYAAGRCVPSDTDRRWRTVAAGRAATVCSRPDSSRHNHSRHRRAA